MQLEETQETELRDLVERLDRLIPREGAHLTMPGDAGERSTMGSRLGYLRLGVEVLKAALRPLPGDELAPARIEPDLRDLISEGSRTPFELCEVDEAIGSRAPVETRLGVLGQLVAGVLVVAVLLLVFVGGSFVLGWLFR